MYIYTKPGEYVLELCVMQKKKEGIRFHWKGDECLRKKSRHFKMGNFTEFYDTTTLKAGGGG